MPVRGKGDDIGKIFVGGLATSTTKEGLHQYFENFGEVTDCVLMTDPTTKRSRGFGFVTFRDPATIESVLAKKPHILDGKTIDPKPAVPRGPGQQAQTGAVMGGPQRGSANDGKVFIGGLAFGTTEEDLKEYFSTYGMVKNVQLMYDKDTQKMRGFGFLTFESKESVDKTTQIQFHQINGKMVEVKKAEYRERGQQSKDHQMGGNPLATPLHMGGGQYGGQYMHQGGYGQQGGMPGMGRGYGAGNQGFAYGAAAPGAGGYGYAPQGGPPSYGANMPMGGGPPSAAPGYQGAGGYGTQPGPGAMGAYGAPPREAPGAYAPQSGYVAAAGYGATPAPGAIPPGAADYGQAGVPPTSAIPGSAALPTAQPRAEAPSVGDYGAAYSSYGLGNYQQTDSQYGPARSSFPADPAYAGYPAAESYPAGPGAGPAPAFAAGESFGRGGGAATRGFHPYGR
ncbi:DAZ-associated protein 1 [Nematostella vectensis]|uniref:DAZ-associated protein 1 n=1 Tax=Nematostella vectensis TaxID=45351 RepID=UPI002076F861|nr:DAZ-associated protein 1 [Nematostella vectensis]